MSLNIYNPQCTLDQCLNQVVGNVDFNPAAQASACVSLFGTPATVMVTDIPDLVLSTSTVTVPYTDIIISTSTVYSPVHETSTSYVQVPQTVTEFTGTRVSTETVQATAPAVTFLRKRDHHRKLKRRGACKAKSSSLSSAVPTSSTPTSEEPSTTLSEAPLAGSTEEASVTSSSSAPALISTAPNCANLEQYSSACRCIGAVSDATQTATLTDAVPTSLTTETVTSTVPSTSTSVITVLVTETQTQLATTTATTTVQTIQDSVQTATTTLPGAIAPTVTALLRTNPLNRLITVAGQYVQYDYGNTGNGAKFQLISSSGRLSLIDKPNDTLWVRTPSTNYGVLWMQPASGATGTDLEVTCVPDNQGNLSCATPANGGVYNTVYSCGAYLYLGRPTWVQSGCTKVALTLKTA